MISLADAVPLKSKIMRRLNELIRERDQAATVTITKGEEWEKPVRSVEVITQEIDAVQAQFIELDDLITKANSSNTVEWDGKNISLTVAIEFNKLRRKEADYQKSLGSRKKTERGGGRGYYGGGDADLITVATYDPEIYRVNGLKLERQCNLLSKLIDDKNDEITIDFDASEYMGM